MGLTENVTSTSVCSFVQVLLNLVTLTLTFKIFCRLYLETHSVQKVDILLCDIGLSIPLYYCIGGPYDHAGVQMSLSFAFVTVTLTFEIFSGLHLESNIV